MAFNVTRVGYISVTDVGTNTQVSRHSDWDEAIESAGNRPPGSQSDVTMVKRVKVAPVAAAPAPTPPAPAPTPPAPVPAPPAPAPAPTPAARTVRSLGWNMAHVEQVADFYPQFYLDRVRSGRAFGPVVGAGGGFVPLDENGWPTVACVQVMSARGGSVASGNTPTSDTANMRVGEVYSCRVDGSVNVGAFGGCVLSKPTVDGPYKLFTLTVVGNPVVLSYSGAIPLGVKCIPQGYDINTTETWDRERLALLAEFGGLRSMKLLATEGNPPPPSTWATRPTPKNSKTGYLELGMPLEDVIDLANALHRMTGGAFKSVSIYFHHLQGPEYVTAAAELIKANLLPGVVPWWGWSNEPWNTQYRAQGYYFALGRTLTESICNNMDGNLQEIASVVRVGGVVTVTTLADVPWTADRAINVTALGIGAKNVQATLTGPRSFTYPNAGPDLALTGVSLRNVVISGTPGRGVDFDNVCSFDQWRDRAYARDLRRMALLIESVLGPARTHVYLEHKFVDAPLHLFSYLAHEFPDRAPNTYIAAAACAVYLEPKTGGTVDELFAALETELVRYGEVAKTWAQTCAAYGLPYSMYEWGFDMRSVTPADDATVAAMHDDPRMESITRRLFQRLLDLGFQGGYYHIVTPMFSLGKKAFNLCKTFGDISPKRRALRSLMDVVPATIDAHNVIPGVLRPVAGWPKVFARDSFGYVGGSSEAWMVSGGHFGLQGSSIAQRRWFEHMVFAPAAGDYTADVMTCLFGKVDRTWTLTIDGREIDFTVHPTPGQKSGFYMTPQAYNGPFAIGHLEAGWHRLRVTTQQIAPTDQVGCDEITIARTA